MKLIILVALFAFACAEIIETYESGPLVVPENKEEFLAKIRNLPSKGRNGRISNGNPAAEGQFSYIGRLTIIDEPFDWWTCSGAIISTNFVITVRHCFDPQLTVSVVVNSGSIDHLSSEMVTRFSDFWWFAPAINGWNPDLAVVRLSEHFTFNNRINSVRLPARSQENFEWLGETNTIIGWGRNAAGSMPQFLQYGLFRMQSNCWSNRRPTHLCSVAQNIIVETRGGDCFHNHQLLFIQVN